MHKAAKAGLKEVKAELGAGGLMKGPNQPTTYCHGEHYGNISPPMTSKAHPEVHIAAGLLQYMFE
jgi:hypothetical protein